jgi:hypothetical protein
MSVFDTYMMMMIYLTAIGLTPGGSSTVHIYTQTIHRILNFNQGRIRHQNHKTVLIYTNVQI